MDAPLIHPVPDILLQTDIAIIGQKGAGKSVCAKGLVERNLAAGRRTIIVDPLNHWYGLKANADGSPGFPIIVIGGPNADILLNVAGGERLGEVLAASDRSFVVDVSDLLKSQMTTFMIAFLGSLYRHNREALWLVLEEGDIFACQNPAADGSRNLHDVCDQIARRGRQRGFRLWTLTQRPARLSKDVLTQASTLIVMRIRSPQDRSAAEDWIMGHAEKAQAKEVLGALASLEVGQGFVYAPDLDLLDKVRFPMIQTLDTSSTPQVGEARPSVGALPAADVEAIRAALEPPEAKPPQPSAKSGAAPTAPPGVDLEAVQKEARVTGHVAGYKIGYAEGHRVALEMVEKHVAGLKVAVAAPGVEAPMRQAASATVAGSVAATDVVVIKNVSPRLTAKVTAPDVITMTQEGIKNAAARKLYAAVCRYADVGLTWAEVCIVAGMMPGNGYFYGGRKELVDDTWVRDEGGRIFPVEPDQEARPLTRAEFKTLWGSRKQPAPRMFDALCEAGDWVSLEDLAREVGLKAGNGFWYGGLAQLRSAGLIEQNKTRARVVELIRSARP